MVVASARWLSVRLDLLSSLLTGSVAIAAVLVSQDAGVFTYSCHQKTITLKGWFTRATQTQTQAQETFTHRTQTQEE